VAVEPAAGMRAEAQRRHPDPRIRWIDDRLPDLGATHRLELAFDVILLSAVWMHVSTSSRAHPFRKVATLLKSGGVILMTLREGLRNLTGRCGQHRPARWKRSPGLTVWLCRARSRRPCRAGEVHWTAMCLRLPDDGAGALPLLRGNILNDEKS